VSKNRLDVDGLPFQSDVGDQAVLVAADVKHRQVADAINGVKWDKGGTEGTKGPGSMTSAKQSANPHRASAILFQLRCDLLPAKPKE